MSTGKRIAGIVVDEVFERVRVTREYRVPAYLPTIEVRHPRGARNKLSFAVAVALYGRGNSYGN